MGRRANVKLTRFLFAFAACVMLSAFPFDKASAGYPERIIKIVVPQAAGNSPDVLCRIIADKLSKGVRFLFRKNKIDLFEAEGIVAGPNTVTLRPVPGKPAPAAAWRLSAVG